MSLELQKLSDKLNLNGLEELDARDYLQRQSFTKYLRQALVFM